MYRSKEFNFPELKQGKVPTLRGNDGNYRSNEEGGHGLLYVKLKVETTNPLYLSQAYKYHIYL